jgi:hypothetical protein
VQGPAGRRSCRRPRLRTWRALGAGARSGWTVEDGGAEGALARRERHELAPCAGPGRQANYVVHTYSPPGVGKAEVA